MYIILEEVERSLYIKNIPVESLSKDEKFVAIVKEDKTSPNLCLCDYMMPPSGVRETTFVENKFVDVFICMLKVKIECERCEDKSSQASCPALPEDPPQEPEVESKIFTPKLSVSKHVLNFGLLPQGVETSATFTIINLEKEPTKWRLQEITFSPLKMHCESENVNQTTGTTIAKTRINYKVVAKAPIRWISLLALFSIPDYTLECIILITYEVCEISVSIYTETSKLPMLIPHGPLYINQPSFHTVYVENHGLVPGCFYFLRTVGDDAPKVRLKFTPNSGVVLPGQCVELVMELEGREAGVLEDIHVPCFTGDPYKITSLLLVVLFNSVNVHFYLPINGGLGRHLWPPRVDSSLRYWSFAMGEAEPSGCFPEDGFMAEPSKNTVDSLVDPDALAYTYPTVRLDSSLVKTPVKLRFYVENLTPIIANFTIEAVNYGPENESFNDVLVKTGIKSASQYWEEACLQGFGIVVEPYRSFGEIIPHEVVELDLWIYANTWGKYLEEIMIEINDLTPFCFNLVIEVIGLPLEFPFALNTILEKPTIRLGNFCCFSGEKTRNVRIVNTSSIPITINWLIFELTEIEILPFNLICNLYEENGSAANLSLSLSPSYYGIETRSGPIKLNPMEFTLQKQEEILLKITLDTNYPSKKHLQYNLIGLVQITPENKSRKNYFERTLPLLHQLSVTATLENPLLLLELITEEKTLNISVIDILKKSKDLPKLWLVLQNLNKCTIHFSLDIEKPFVISKIEDDYCERRHSTLLELKQDQGIDVVIDYEISVKDVYAFAEFVYQDDSSDYCARIKKDLIISQEGFTTQKVSFEIALFYPHIEVSNTCVDFFNCLLFQTKKSVVTLYNCTSCSIDFKIQKPCNLDNFEMRPTSGTIPATTGANTQFIDIYVYFTPRECQLYHGFFQICTKFHQGNIRIVVMGHGKTNEKFA